MEAKLNLFKSISDRNRLRVIMALMTYEELCACQIIELLQVTGATVSKHLGQLNNAGLIKSRKEGRWIYFRIKKEDQQHKKFLTWLFEDLKLSKDYIEDVKQLKKIMASLPETLCKKQRGEDCC
jgi:ArsR family transcriptional regulator